MTLILSELRELLSKDRSQLTAVAELYIQCWGGVLERELQVLVPERRLILQEIEKQFWMRNKVFPEGEFIIFNPYLQKPVGGISALRRTFSSPREINEDYLSLTGGGYFTTHEPEGNTLLCVAVYVAPEYQANGLSKFLIQAELELADRLGMEYRIAFSRAEGLRRFCEQLGRKRIPPQYQGADRELLFYLDQIQITKPLETGERRTVFDKSLSTHLKYGAHPVLDKEGKVRFIRWSRLADTDGGCYNIPMQYERGVKAADLGELARLE